MLKHLRKPENLIKYLIATILLVVPLYPKFPFITVPGTFVSIRLEDFILVFAFLVLFVLVGQDKIRFFRNKINQAIILSLLAGFISLISAILITKTILIHIGFLHWLRRVEYFIPFFIGIYAFRRSNKNLEFYLKVMMLSLLISFFYGLGQKYLSWPIIVTQNLEYSRGIALRYIPGGHLNSTFAGHYDLGTTLVLILPIFVSLFFLIKKVRIKAVLFVVISGGLWLLAFSGSRVSTVSYLLATFVSLLLIKRLKFYPFVVIFSIIIFSFSPNLVARYSRIFEVTYEKVKEFQKILVIPDKTVYAQETMGPLRRDVPVPTSKPTEVFEDRSTSIRLNVEWPRALRALEKNPLLGTGYSSITLATDNDYLRLLGEVGIIGALAFFLIFIRLLKVVLNKVPLRNYFKNIELGYLGGIYGGVIGVFINAVFIDVFEASKFAIIYWLLIGLAVSLHSNKVK